MLKGLFVTYQLPLNPTSGTFELLQYIPNEQHFDTIWEQVTTDDGEGIIAKLKKVNGKLVNGQKHG